MINSFKNCNRKGKKKAEDGGGGEGGDGVEAGAVRGLLVWQRTGAGRRVARRAAPAPH